MFCSFVSHGTSQGIPAVLCSRLLKLATPEFAFDSGSGFISQPAALHGLVRL